MNISDCCSQAEVNILGSYTIVFGERGNLEAMFKGPDYLVTNIEKIRLDTMME